jgi:hypothetical protein
MIPDVTELRYDVLLEFEGAAPDLNAMSRSLDAALANENIEYASKRGSSRLRALRVHAMSSGWSERQCRADFQRGKREYQYKFAYFRDEWDPLSREDVLASQQIDATVDGR